jgi:hypothetical protein
VCSLQLCAPLLLCNFYLQSVHKDKLDLRLIFFQIVLVLFEGVHEDEIADIGAQTSHILYMKLC